MGCSVYHIAKKIMPLTARARALIDFTVSDLGFRDSDWVASALIPIWFRGQGVLLSRGARILGG